MFEGPTPSLSPSGYLYPLRGADQSVLLGPPATEYNGSPWSPFIYNIQIKPPIANCKSLRNPRPFQCCGVIMLEFKKTNKEK